MKKIILSAIVLLAALIAFSQERLMTKSGKLSFYSDAPLEDIEAHNKNAVSVLDRTTGQVEFIALIKGFEFEKALMQEHFNENYMESDKYPKAIFKGKISDINKVIFSKDGTYAVTVTGMLTIHGETKEVSSPASFTISNGAVTANAEFSVVLRDYKISLPAIVKDKIAQNVRIVVNAKYQTM
jgi:hypothetical protein